MESRGSASMPRGTRVVNSVECSNSNGAQRSLNHDPNHYMSVTSVMRILQRILPDEMKVDDDAKESIQKHITEFINLITREANERCHQDSRNTITTTDIISAMAAIGFDDYVEPLVAFINKHHAQDHSTPDTAMDLPQVQTQRTYFPSPFPHPLTVGAYEQKPQLPTQMNYFPSPLPPPTVDAYEYLPQLQTQLTYIPSPPPPPEVGYVPSPPQDGGDYIQMQMLEVETVRYNSTSTFGGEQGLFDEMEFDPFN